MEIATLTREDGKTKIKVLRQKEVEELIKRHEAEEAKAEKDKKDKEQKEKDKWATSHVFSPHVIKFCIVLSFTLKVWKLLDVLSSVSWSRMKYKTDVTLLNMVK